MDDDDDYLSSDDMHARDSYFSKDMDADDSYLSKDIDMDAYFGFQCKSDSDPLLSEKDILYELFCGRKLVLKDGELEAGYGACKNYTQIAKAPHVLRLQFDCATRLGLKDEAVQIALLASAQYEFTEITADMYFALGEYFFKNKDLRRARDNLSMANAVAQDSNYLDIDNIVDRSLILLAEVKSSLYALQNTSTHQQDRASSSHPKESEKEQRTEGFDQCMSLEGSESLPLRNQQKQAAPAQSAIVYQPLLMPMGVAKDTEVEKGEKSIFLCFSNWIQGRYGCDWYRLDLVKKECGKSLCRLEWGGIPTKDFGVATVGSIIYILGGLYPENLRFIRSRMDWTICNDVFYLDVNHPRDGWKAGPQLPSPHLEPVATSMNETVYIFNGKYVFARALDTSDSGSGWKSLADSPNLESLAGGLHFVMAFPDPIRDRIVLLSEYEDLFAYYPRNEVLEVISYQLQIGLNVASVIVDGVLYYNDYFSGVLLCAYDLDQRELLTPIYSPKFDLAPGLSPHWDHLLDLGGCELCLVGHAQQKELVLFSKLKVQKEAGGEVQITVLSFDTFRIVGGSCYEHSIAL